MDCSQGFLLPLLLATIQDHPNLFPVMDSIWTTLTILVILAIFKAHMHTWFYCLSFYGHAHMHTDVAFLGPCYLLAVFYSRCMLSSSAIRMFIIWSIYSCLHGHLQGIFEWSFFIFKASSSLQVTFQPQAFVKPPPWVWGGC